MRRLRLSNDRFLATGRRFGRACQEPVIREAVLRWYAESEQE